MGLAMSQCHCDGQSQADAGFQFRLNACLVSLETVALIEVRKVALQRGTPLVSLAPGIAVTWRGREDATVLREFEAHHAAVVRDLTAVLLLTLPIARAVQLVDRSRTAILQGPAIFLRIRKTPFPAAAGT